MQQKQIDPDAGGKRNLGIPPSGANDVTLPPGEHKVELHCWVGNLYAYPTVNVSAKADKRYLLTGSRKSEGIFTADIKFSVKVTEAP